MITVLHFENKKIIKDDITTYTFSTYFPKMMRKAMNSHMIKENHFVLCPLYDKGDFQIGVTGKVKLRETFFHGINRELGEEVGLIIKNRKKLYYIKPITKKNTINQSFVINIKDTKPVPINNKNFIDLRPDTNNKKVGCIIYGEESDIISFMQKPIYRFLNDDKIIGLVSINVKDVKNRYN